MSEVPLPQIAISGYYGCGNAGDEAVLAGIRASFEKVAPEKVKLVALSQNPIETTCLHTIQSAYRMSLPSLQATFDNTDLLLSGGGSLLQDTTSVRSLLYYLFVCRMAQKREIPVMFYAQGLGPLRRPFSRWMVQRVANRAEGITVRDVGSQRLLEEIGVRKPPIEVTADPAFALNPVSTEEIEAIFAKESLPQGKSLIGVALRSWGQEPEKTAENYALLLDRLAGEVSGQMVMLPMQLPDDLLFSRKVVSMTRHAGEFLFLENSYTPEELLGVVSRLESVIAMRLHTLIFAARVGVPAFAFSYDPKVESLMQSLGLEKDCVGWHGFQVEGMVKRILETFGGSATRRLHLMEIRDEFERRALRNAERAMEILNARL
jgi:polysaccharide pyruvyl transferase CsaB